jgi:hypothetical protein
MKYDVATRSVLTGMLFLFATASVVVGPMGATFMAKESAAQNPKVTQLMTKELAGLAGTAPG